MKYLKLYESFLNQKWILGVNENIFSKIEDLVKGKSEKGKIINELLTKNGIQPKGSAYMIHFLGGSEPGKTELSNPYDYLSFTPNICKITSYGVMVVVDEKAKTLQVPDTLTFLSVMEKDEIAKNFTFGLKPGSSVKKADYEYDLSKDIPTLSMKQSQYSVPQQKWNPIGEDQVIELDEDISEMSEEDVISFKTPITMITLQQWVEKLNATGWIKKDKEYFSKYFQTEGADKQEGGEQPTETKEPM